MAILDSSPTHWAGLVASLSGRRLLVLGDVMLDEYVSGDARRVCPEAPVPVVETARRWAVPGGAANAATNAVGLGGHVILGGITGDDSARVDLTRAVEAAGVDPAGLITDPKRPTTTKLRILARNQQVIRVDTESTEPLAPEPAEQLTVWAERTIDRVDAVLLSDYGKGVIVPSLSRRFIAAAVRAGRPVVVDPKKNPPECYRGATVIKPNLAELGDLTKLPIQTQADLIDAGCALAESLSGTAILVTRGAEGMALFRAGQVPLLLPPAPAHRVYDVTGAGDTVAAVLTLALAAGLSVETAARMANAAAGLVVCKVGTSVVTPDELLAVLLGGPPDFKSWEPDHAEPFSNVVRHLR